jgi:hypothetical protein
MEPIIALAENYRLNARELRAIQSVIERRKDDILKAWDRHFKT